MTIIDRYIIKKFMGSFMFILMIILIIALVIDVAEKIDDFIEHQPPVYELVFNYYVNFLLYFGNLLSPICVFLAVIFFTSRLAQNSEIVPILSGGVNFYRLLVPYLFTAVILAILAFVLNAFLVPVATAERIEFEYKYLKKKTIFHDHNIQRKISAKKDGNLETFVYFYSFNQFRQEGHLFQMDGFDGPDIVRSIKCQRAVYIDSTESWLLKDCVEREFNDMEEKLTFHKTIDTTFLLSPDDIYVKDQRAQSIPLDELYPYIELEKERGTDLVEELILEKYKRYAYPFATIILTMIGFSVSTQKRRGGTALQLGIGLVISFLFVTLIVAGEAISMEGFPDWLKVWYPNMLFFLAAIGMLRIAPK